MTTKEMIETLIYKGTNIKAKIEPDFFFEVADRLEKQVAKKVIVRDIGVDTYDCPSCENVYLGCGGVYNYCPNCGQKLDLSEVE